MSVRLCCCCCLLLSSAVPAKVLWQDFSVSLLQGEHYRVYFPKQQVLTFEHSAATSWGDSFLFYDHLRGEDGSRNNYAEWAPRFSFSKLSGTQFSNGILTDVLLSTQVEMSRTQTNYLYGVGLDFAIAGFKYSKLNLLRRQNEHSVDNWQATLVWGLPFQLFGQQWLYDGFVDWASPAGSQQTQLNWTSQLKWALHPLLDLSSPLYLGVEYVYWRHRFGLADTPQRPTHESNLNLLVKWHF